MFEQAPPVLEGVPARKMSIEHDAGIMPHFAKTAWIRSKATQPIPFPHKTHVEKAMLKCTDYCHETVTKGPRAGLPSVKTCMICHDAIAVDRPLIQKVADYQKRGVDIPWQRVYGFTQDNSACRITTPIKR